MTNEEIERAFDFLVKSQAAFDVRQAAFDARQAAFDTRLEQTNQQIAEMSKQIQIYAETQTAFIQIVTRTLEAQAEINTSLRAAIARTDERVNKTDERLDRLAAMVERNISGGNGST